MFTKWHLLFYFYWKIVDIQYYANFRCTNDLTFACLLNDHHDSLISAPYSDITVLLTILLMLYISSCDAKECSNYCTIALISHTSKLFSKMSKPGFNSMWTKNFQMFNLYLEKADEPEIKLPTSAGSSKKQESSRKTSISAFLTMPKTLTVWITTNCMKFFKRWEYQTVLPASWETCMQVKRQLLESDMEQKSGSKLGKEYIKAVYCHSVYLTYMQNTSCKMLGWMKPKLE